MYSNNSFNYNYDLHCTAEDAGGNVCIKFDAREYAEETRNMEFIGSGAASFSGAYVIATSRQFSEEDGIRAGKIIKVDGNNYRIVSMHKQLSSICGLKKRYETIINLGGRK